MNIQLNPTIEMDVDNMTTIRKAMRICSDLLGAFAMSTITDEAFVVCADNGEVLATEKELYAMYSTLNTIDRIFNEAPSTYDGSGHKVLAVEFIG